jgi:protein-S-isoprenylcysteine O-methyltransferase Ste14
VIFRWAALATLLGVVGTSAYFRYRARLEGPHVPRRAEGAPFMVGRAGVALPLFVGLLAYVLNPAWMDWSAVDLPVAWRWIGVVIGLLAIPFSQWVFRSLGRNVSETVLTKAQHDLVTEGPYRWIRHPLYLTGIATFLAIGLMAANWFILLFTAIAAGLVRAVVVPVEERHLCETFGERYATYQARTGRLLPRFLPPRA